MPGAQDPGGCLGMAPGAISDAFPQFTSQVGGTSLRAKVWGEFACSRIWMESRVSLQLWFLELFLLIFPLPSESTAVGSGIWGPQL